MSSFLSFTFPYLSLVCLSSPTTFHLKWDITLLSFALDMKWSIMLQILLGCLDDYLSLLYSWRQSRVRLFTFLKFLYSGICLQMLVILLSSSHRVLYPTLQQLFDNCLYCYVGYLMQAMNCIPLSPNSPLSVVYLDYIPIDWSYKYDSIYSSCCFIVHTHAPS